MSSRDGKGFECTVVNLIVNIFSGSICFHINSGSLFFSPFITNKIYFCFFFIFLNPIVPYLAFTFFCKFKKMAFYKLSFLSHSDMIIYAAICYHGNSFHSLVIIYAVICYHGNSLQLYLSLQMIELFTFLAN